MTVQELILVTMVQRIELRHTDIVAPTCIANHITIVIFGGKKNDNNAMKSNDFHSQYCAAPLSPIDREKMIDGIPN